MFPEEDSLSVPHNMYRGPARDVFIAIYSSTRMSTLGSMLSGCDGGYLQLSFVCSLFLTLG
jgi:hypothetical protein